MITKKYSEKKKFVREEKRLEKKHYAIIVLLILFGALYHYCIEPFTIGHDNRYTLYIFCLPTAVGMLLMGIYRRKFLISRFVLNKGFVLWTFMTFFYLLQGVMFSYLTIGQTANVAWNMMNERTAKQHAEESISCEVTKFSLGRNSNAIWFNFKGRHESVKVSYAFIKEYLGKDLNDYELQVDVQKGIWNYYLVNKWTIVEK